MDDHKKEKKNRIKIESVLKDFYKNYSPELLKQIKKEKLKKEYINNIDEIHL